MSQGLIGITLCSTQTLRQLLHIYYLVPVLYNRGNHAGLLSKKPQDSFQTGHRIPEHDEGQTARCYTAGDLLSLPPLRWQ